MFNNTTNTDVVSVSVKGGACKCYVTNNTAVGNSFSTNLLLIIAVIKILIQFYTSNQRPVTLIYSHDVNGDSRTYFLWCRWVEGRFVQVNIYDYFVWTGKCPTLPVLSTVQQCEKHSLSNFESTGEHYAHHYHLEKDDFVLVLDTVFGAPAFQVFRSPKLLSITDMNMAIEGGCLSTYRTNGADCVTDIEFYIDISDYLSVAKTL